MLESNNGPMRKEEPPHLKIAQAMLGEILSHPYPEQNEMIVAIKQGLLEDRRDSVKSCEDELNTHRTQLAFEGIQLIPTPKGQLH